jgi:hypothetical protein
MFFSTFKGHRNFGYNGHGTIFRVLAQTTLRFAQTGPTIQIVCSSITRLRTFG